MQWYGRAWQKWRIPSNIGVSEKEIAGRRMKCDSFPNRLRPTIRRSGSHRQHKLCWIPFYWYILFYAGSKGNDTHRRIYETHFFIPPFLRNLNPTNETLLLHIL